MKRILFLSFFVLMFCPKVSTQTCAVHFMSDSFRLTSGEEKVLDDFVTSLGTEVFNYRITISGFTDATGGRAYNDTLSSNRARAVEHYLESKGIRSDNLLVEHHGPDRPVGSNNTDNGKALNRRVEVKAEKWDAILLDKMNMQVPVERFTINAQKGGTITTKDGQQIIIPADALIDQNGKKVKGNVQIEFTQYNDPVDMMFSGFPMSYTQDGVEHDYHSAGMFSLRAFQNSKLLSIAADTSVRIRFNLSDTTGKFSLYRFNGADNQWKEQHPDAFIQEPKAEQPKTDQPKADQPKTDEPKTDQPKTDEPKNLPQIKLPQTNTDPQKIIEDKKRRLVGYISPCEGMRLAIKTGYYYFHQDPSIKNDSLIPVKVNPKPMNFDERWESMLFAGTDSINFLPEYHFDISLKKDKKKFKGKVPFRIIDKDSSNDELYDLLNAEFVFDSKHDTISLHDFSTKFCDFRLFYDAGTDVFTLKLKSKKGYTEFPVAMINTADKKMHGADLQVWHARIFDDYTASLNQRGAAFNKTLIPKKPIVSTGENGEAVYPEIYSFSQDFSDYAFWLFSKPFMNEAERAMADTVWIEYFRAHPDEMKTRYEMLYKHLETICSGRDTLIRCIDCIPIGDCIKCYAGPPSPNVDIRIFGTYNFDAVYDKKNVVHLNVIDYYTPDGYLIHAKLLYLIDLSINGISKQDPYHFRLNKTSQNIILIVDEHGHRYFISPADLEKMIFLDNNYYTFHAPDITAETPTMVKLRERIGIGK